MLLTKLILLMSIADCSSSNLNPLELISNRLTSLRMDSFLFVSIAEKSYSLVRSIDCHSSPFKQLQSKASIVIILYNSF